MLKISIYRDKTATALASEGKLAGPWVGELERCWLTVMAAESPPSIVVDLTEVSFIDAAGKELLSQMYRRGAKLVAVDCLTKSVVEEIERGEASGQNHESLMSAKARDPKADVRNPPETERGV
jgi:anti-anti-sigma regulatory factor